MSGGGPPVTKTPADPGSRLSCFLKIVESVAFLSETHGRVLFVRDDVWSQQEVANVMLSV